MNCEKCGYALLDVWNVCPICSRIINNKTIHVQNEQVPINIENRQNPINESKTKSDYPEKRYSDTERSFILAFAISLFLSIFFYALSSHERNSNNLSMLAMISHLVALVSIVTAYIKFPKNRTIAIMFWVYIYLVVSTVVGLFVLALACAAAWQMIC